MSKPSDFFLGVVDLFGVLLPGVLFAGLLSGKRDILLDGFGITEPKGVGWAIAGLFTAGYVLGHLLRALGEPIDRYLYDRFYLPAIKRGPEGQSAMQILKSAGKALPTRTPSKGAFDPLLEMTETLVRRHIDEKVPRSTFSWVNDYLRIRDPGSHAAVERLTADSKFFRSLLLLALVSIPLSLAWGDPSLSLVIVIALTGLLSAHQFLRLRWKATTLLYQSYILLAVDPFLNSASRK